MMRWNEIVNEEPKAGYYDTYLPDDYEPYFEIEEIAAIEDWIETTNPRTTNLVKNVLDGMPISAKKTSVTKAYRYFKANLNQVEDLLKGASIPCKEYESWSETYDGACHFASIVGGSDLWNIILISPVDNSNIILNVRALLRSGEWEDSVEYWSNQIEENPQLKKAWTGAHYFGNLIKDHRIFDQVPEIILRNKEFDLNDVIVFSEPGSNLPAYPMSKEEVRAAMEAAIKFRT